MKFLDEIFDIKEYNNISISGLTNQLASFLVDKINKDTKKDILIVTNSLYEANRYYSSLSKINNNCYLFGMDDFLTSEALATSPELKSIRINTLNEIAKSKNNIVITNLMGYLRYLPNKKLWKKSKITLEKNKTISKDDLYKKLIAIGYEPETLVTKTGEISSRGYIIDIFPINYDNPIRIEFWGDEIDSIREFDIDSQISKNQIDKIEINPYSEFINEKGLDIEDKQKYLTYVVDDVSSIKDYLDNPIIIYKDYNQIKSSYLNLKKEILEYDSEKKSEYKTNYMHNFEDLETKDNNVCY